MNEHTTTDHDGDASGGGVEITLEARPARRLVRPTGSHRHIVFSLRVGELARQVERRPLTVGLVLDRSGSMSGNKLRDAKRVVQKIFSSLGERDRAAIVIFDEHIDVLQPLAEVTPEVRDRIRRELDAVHARGSTALHEGWLTGCRAIAGDDLPADERSLARCWLFTDGQANVGETDPERIATEASGIRDNARIGTSTFGFGADYNEELLGPMAVAGGGQFHHLESSQDIARAFEGELGALFAVAAMRVRLEVELAGGMTIESLSAYRGSYLNASEQSWAVDLGDLAGGEERRVVVTCGFPTEDRAFSYTVRARLVWTDDSGDRTGEWQELTFTQASHAECDAEPMDMSVMRWVGLAYEDRARVQAVTKTNAGDYYGAERLLRRTAERIRRYAGDDAALKEAIFSLLLQADEIPMWSRDAMVKKGMYSSSQARSRGQKDYRSDR